MTSPSFSTLRARRPRLLPLLFVSVLSAGWLAACSNESTDSPAAKQSSNPIVVITTNQGAFEVELYPDKAPATVENFLKYVDDEFYDGTLFHRVIDNFMIQGGGYDSDQKKKPTNAPVKNEADNGLKNENGTIAMARTSDPDSASSQFFINVADNAFLDFKEPTVRGYGYAVFGRVVSGKDVVNKLKSVKTQNLGGAFQNIPKDLIVIETVRRK